MDAAKPETVVSVIEETVRDLGTPDVLVYNVGITEPDGERKIDSKLLLEHYQIDCASGWDAAMTVGHRRVRSQAGRDPVHRRWVRQTFQPIPSCARCASTRPLKTP